MYLASKQAFQTAEKRMAFEKYCYKGTFLLIFFSRLHSSFLLVRHFDGQGFFAKLNCNFL